MDGSNIVKWLVLGALPGASLYVLGAFLQPILQPGWGDIIQGLAGFAVIIGAALGFRRAMRPVEKQAAD